MTWIMGSTATALTGFLALSGVWGLHITRHASEAGAAYGRQAQSGLDDLRAAYLAAYNAGDASAMEDLYVAEAVRMPYDAPEQDGRDAVLAYYRSSFANRRFRPTLRLTAGATEIRDDLAMERGAYVEILEPPNGGASLTERGKYVTLAREDEDGKWRYVWSIFNRDAAPARSRG
jgi:uncharacterized protein (TIGR02246 family)